MDPPRNPETVQRRVQFPLVECSPAEPGAEMTPEELAEVLIEDEARWALQVEGEPRRLEPGE